MNDDDFEFQSEWESDEETNLSLEEYDYECRVRDYGATKDESSCGDEND